MLTTLASAVAPHADRTRLPRILVQKSGFLREPIKGMRASPTVAWPGSRLVTQN